MGKFTRSTPLPSTYNNRSSARRWDHRHETLRNEKLLVTSGIDGHVRLWEPNRLTEIDCLSLPDGDPQTLAIDPQSAEILVSTTDALFAWDLNERKWKTILQDEELEYVAVTGSPNGHAFALSIVKPGDYLALWMLPWTLPIAPFSCDDLFEEDEDN